MVDAMVNHPALSGQSMSIWRARRRTCSRR